MHIMPIKPFSGMAYVVNNIDDNDMTDKCQVDAYGLAADDDGFLWFIVVASIDGDFVPMFARHVEILT